MAPDTIVGPTALVRVTAVMEEAVMVLREEAVEAVSPRSVIRETRHFQTPAVAAVEAVVNQAAVMDTAAAAVLELSSSATHSDHPALASRTILQVG